ncbi:MAG TPA: putative glycoside hydrolase, partial [Gaiellaceae bacterium]|nr:putative glycoside hydrolase [Gaiellaceae bacterium]
MTAAGPRRLVLAAAAALWLFLLPGVAHAAAPAGIGALRICSGCAQSGGDLSRYRYVVLNPWDAPLLPALKAANPGLKALVYKNLSFTMSYGCVNGVDKPYLTSGVGYCDADRNHPDWFLTDQNGSRLDSYYFQQAWLMDVGNPAYQARWLSNVLDDLHGGGWDGVLLDDT